MKSLAIFFLFLFIGCTKDTSNNINGQLPPETQTGANTFGVTINGKVYIPRDPTGFSTFPTSHGVSFNGSSSGDWNDIVIVDGASSVGFKMVIHFKKLIFNYVGAYQLKGSNFHEGIDSNTVDQIYFKIWDNTNNKYSYYGSVENQGNINVTRFNGSSTVNWILSGNFNGKFVSYENPNNIINITDGRFDLNLNTLGSHVFP